MTSPLSHAKFSIFGIISINISQKLLSLQTLKPRVVLRLCFTRICQYTYEIRVEDIQPRPKPGVARKLVPNS